MHMWLTSSVVCFKKDTGDISEGEHFDEKPDVRALGSGGEVLRVNRAIIHLDSVCIEEQGGRGDEFKHT